MNVNSYLFLFVRPKSGCYCNVLVEIAVAHCLGKLTVSFQVDVP